jgi:hypothetical protein
LNPQVDQNPANRNNGNNMSKPNTWQPQPDATMLHLPSTSNSYSLTMPAFNSMSAPNTNASTFAPSLNLESTISQLNQYTPNADALAKLRLTDESLQNEKRARTWMGKSQW